MRQAGCVHTSDEVQTPYHWLQRHAQTPTAASLTRRRAACTLATRCSCGTTGPSTLTCASTPCRTGKGHGPASCWVVGLSGKERHVFDITPRKARPTEARFGTFEQPLKMVCVNAKCHLRRPYGRSTNTKMGINQRDDVASISACLRALGACCAADNQAPVRGLRLLQGPPRKLCTDTGPEPMLPTHASSPPCNLPFLTLPSSLCTPRRHDGCEGAQQPGAERRRQRAVDPHAAAGAAAHAGAGGW